MNILHIDCSPRVESHSRQLSSEIVALLLVDNPVWLLASLQSANAISAWK